tara:strand:- start:924 stop:1199 length:276 start_codon:yes stop_codon:yes gene_type:complete
MFIITINGKERDGAYSVTDDEGEQVLYIFHQEDDAMRYSMQLEEMGYPEMHVIQVEDDVMIKTCEMHDHRYAIINPTDIVVPPENALDFMK